MNHFKDKVVLVVEDDAGYRELVGQELASVNAIAFFSESGKQAVDAFQCHQEIIQCVLITTELPLGVSGYEVYDVAEDRLVRRGVVLLTAESDRQSNRPIELRRLTRDVPQPLEIRLASEIDPEPRRARRPRPVSAIRLEGALALRLKVS